MNRTSLKECPACSSADVVSLQVVEQYHVKAISSDIEVHYSYCNTCGLFSQTNPLDEESLKLYYANSLQLRSTSVSDVELEVFRQQADLMSKHSSLEGKRILEIGPDVGQFLTHLSDNYHSQTFFLEWNKHAVEILNKETQHINYDTLPEPERVDFDFIVIRHVLEHVPKPKPWLEHFKPLLKDSACLFIEVPDWSMIDQHTDQLNFEHVNHFPQLSLSILLTQAGYTPIRQENAINVGYPNTSNRVLRVLAVPASGLQGNGRRLKLVDHIEDGRRRYVTVDSLLSSLEPGAKLAIYGASWLTDAVLRNTHLNQNNVIAIFDKDERKQQDSLYGITVYPPSHVSNIDPDVILILSSYEIQIKDELTAMGFPGRVIGWGDLTPTSKN